MFLYNIYVKTRVVLTHVLNFRLLNLKQLLFFRAWPGQRKKFVNPLAWEVTNHIQGFSQHANLT